MSKQVLGVVGLGVSVFVALVVWSPTAARAGVPECGNMRLEDVGSCEIKGDVQCMAGCTRLGVYKKNCATRLEKVCRNRCTLSAMPTCTDSCTVMCQSRCDAGENITCSHNCFRECEGSCATTCMGSANGEQCRASCEATCDGECDVQCGPVVDAPCYTHCIECCDGSCGAQANMDCQETCQDETFEDCEHELEADCMASCSVTGAIFCDGVYVLSGPQIPTCVNALLTRGIAATDLRVEASATLSTDGKNCSVGFFGGHGRGGAAVFGLLAALLITRSRRRRTCRDA